MFHTKRNRDGKGLVCSAPSMTEPNQATALKDIVVRVAHGYSTGLDFHREALPDDDDSEDEDDKWNEDNFIPEDYDRFDMMQEKISMDERFSSAKKRQPRSGVSEVSSERKTEEPPTPPDGQTK